MNMDNASLHATIIDSFLTKQRPPTIEEVATIYQSTETSTRQSLRNLAEDHGVVLHPHSDEVWIAHPFSAAPTTCVVTSADGRKWWGNCAWCALGVIRLAGQAGVLETRTGGIGDAVSIRIEDGELLDKDYVIHFPIPMRSAWDNVVYTCSVQLLFRDEEEVDDWCASRGICKGDVRPLEQIWRFAGEWYGRHADKDWKKWTVKEAVEIFGRHGLTGPVWALREDARRF